MMRVLPTLFLVPVLFLCTGCFFWFHSHLDTSSSRTDIDDQTLKSIIVGSTTIEDVLLRLGEPQDHHDAPTVFLYRWVWVRGFILVGAGGYGVGGGAAEETTEYTLHILFDEKNKVARYKISSVVLRGHL
jgi:hypothetical protein